MNHNRSAALERSVKYYWGGGELLVNKILIKTFTSYYVKSTDTSQK